MDQRVNNISISKTELQKILIESFSQALELKKDLIQKLINYAVEEIALAKAIESGKTGKYVSKTKVIDILQK